MSSILNRAVNISIIKKKDLVLEEIRKEEESIRERIVNDKFEWYCPDWRKKMWDLMEKPQTSRGARVSCSDILIGGLNK